MEIGRPYAWWWRYWPIPRRVDAGLTGLPISPRPYHHYGVAHRYRNDDTIAGYYEHRLDAVRFGSQR